MDLHRGDTDSRVGEQAAEHGTGGSTVEATTATSGATLVRSLGDVRRGDAATVGAKGANLGELLAAGFAVPDGIVVTTAAYEAAVGAIIETEGDADTSDRILSAALPPEVAGAIRDALGVLAETPVAVRSSAVGEDLAEASFAGQYDTVLEVEGPGAIIEAVKRCWASAFSDRVRDYRKQRGMDASPMAVVIQRLVPADAAGVAFTANPITGARDECLVSAVRGLGERLVSGAATPDEWIVRGDEAEATLVTEDAVTARQVRAVASLARTAAEHFGAPQDVEWAIAGDALFLLQSRPITALPPEPEKRVAPIPMPVEPPAGNWFREENHFPEPPCPFFGRFLESSSERIVPVASELGLLFDTFENRIIGGHVYQRLRPLGGVDRKPPPDWLMPVVGPVLRRLVPSLRERINAGVTARRSDAFYENVERWWNHDRAEIAARNAAFRDRDLSKLSVTELAAHLEDVVEHAADCTSRKHAEVAMCSAVIQGELAVFLQRTLGWDDTQVFECLAGLSGMSTAPGRAITSLAARAAARPQLLAALEQLARTSADMDACTASLAAVDEGFAGDFAAHQREHGCRALRIGILEPNMDEQPALLARLIAGQARTGYDPEAVAEQTRTRREELAGQAREALRHRPADLATFERLYERGARAYPVREDNEAFLMSTPLALLRRAVLACGERLVEVGVCEDHEDALFLYPEELKTALRQGRDGRDLRALIRERRGQHEWARTADLPTYFGEPTPITMPRVDWLPDEVATTMESLMWGLSRLADPESSGRRQDGVGGIDGLASAAGVYEGTVRVVHGEHEFHKVQPGDVLVCKATSPVWSVLFSNLGALVADTGGIGSHQAIIAREYRIPAVTGTGNATELLRDGQRVRVDGNAGRVEILDHGDAGQDDDVQPIPMPVEPPPGSWEREANHFPIPPSPAWRWFLALGPRKFGATCEKLGLLFDGIEFALIGGNAYQRLKPLGGKEAPPPPAWLVPYVMPMLRRAVPALRKRIARGIEARRHDVFNAIVDDWFRRHRPELERRNAELEELDLSALSDADIADHFVVACDHLDHAIGIHTDMTMSVSLMCGELGLFLEETLGWEPYRAFELFAGLSEQSTAPGRAVARLAEQAAAHTASDAIIAILEGADEGVEDRLAAVAPDVAATFAGYLRDFGCRALGTDPIEPNVEEVPQLLARIIAGQLRVGTAPEATAETVRRRRESLLAEARAALADRPGELAELERLYARTLRAYPLREDNQVHTASVPIALYRRAVLACGDRLAAAGAITHRDDAFFLERDELRQALEDRQDRRALVRRRRGEYAWARNADLPEAFGPPTPKEPPPMEWLPAEVRQTMRGMLWFMERMVEPSASGRKQDGIGGVEGLAASPGSYEGTVRVVAGEAEFHKVQPGDVLVCKATSPVWSVLFSNIGALVADTGGVMSHQAIIAREYRIPAVTATGNATELLRDGQRVRVDGDGGWIEILDGAGTDDDDRIRPVPVPVNPPPGSWEREANHMPTPVSPLMRVWFERLNPLLRDGMVRFGFLFDGVEFQIIGDYIYQRLRPMGGKERKPPPQWLVPWIMPVLRRVAPALRHRIAVAEDVARRDEFGAVLAKWRNEIRAERIALNEALRGVELDALSDAEAAAHLERAMDVSVSGIGAHVPIATGLSVTIGRFALWTRRNLGWDDNQIFDLFAGTSEISTAPARAIAEIAALAADRPAVMAVLHSAGADVEERLAQTDGEVAAAFAAYQRDYGCRALSFDPIYPSLDESPQLLASFILEQVHNRRDDDAVARASAQRREQMLARARAELAHRPADLAEFERLFQAALAAYPIREDNQFYNTFVPGALVRKAALECGRRLVANGVFDDPDDVFFLELHEVVAAMSDQRDRRALVRRRRGERAWAMEHEPPATFGPPVLKDPPPMDWLPEEVRLNTEAMIWFMERLVEPVASSRKQDAADVATRGIDGLAAAPGTYEGTVRVVAGESEFHKLQPGDVLVCNATSPVWSVLFARVGALVTDTGGIMSHQAIIAREYRIPAVTGTGNVTELLRDGQRVRVDGDAGHVEVVS